MPNIKQINYMDLVDNHYYQTIQPHQITIDGQITYQIQYQDITSLISNKGNIQKIGYHCDVQTAYFPIYIKLGEESQKKIQIGKTGTYEFQKEEIKNKDGEIIETSNFNITQLQLPQCYGKTMPAPLVDHNCNQVLDYVTSS